MSRQWSAEEDNRLTEIYLNSGLAGLKVLALNRTYAAMLSRVCRLGLVRGTVEDRRLKWSDVELKLLNDYYVKDGIKGCKAKGLTISDKSIYRKANSLGLRCANEEWSASEISVLRVVYPQSGVQGCIDAGLSRSKTSIKNKAQVLGIRMKKKYTNSSANRWTDEDISLLRANYPRYGAKGCIDAGLNRTIEAIKYKARVLGVKVDKYNCEIEAIRSQWTRDEIALLKKYYSSKGSKVCIAKGVKKSVKQIQRKAKVLGLKRNENN